MEHNIDGHKAPVTFTLSDSIPDIFSVGSVYGVQTTTRGLTQTGFSTFQKFLYLRQQQTGRSLDFVPRYSCFGLSWLDGRRSTTSCPEEKTDAPEITTPSELRYTHFAVGDAEAVEEGIAEAVHCSEGTWLAERDSTARWKEDSHWNPCWEVNMSLEDGTRVFRPCGQGGKKTDHSFTACIWQQWIAGHHSSRRGPCI